MLETCIVATIYGLTIKIGLLGNFWVIRSVFGSRRPRNTLGTLSPSDRLRTYIFILAIIDLLVICSLGIRLVFIVMPEVTIETISCRAIFIIDHLVKLASITCLACISIERYITIRKPFSSKTRKRFIKMTPLLAMTLLCAILVSIAIYATNVVASSNGSDCIQYLDSSPIISITKWVIAMSFLVQLSGVTMSYSEIVRHVRRKFLQRKARVCANARVKQPLIAEPRYMRDMTAAIIRIAFFHVFCWLPFCVLRMLPDSMEGLSMTVTTSLRIVTSMNYMDATTWVVFIANWLTYCNSAGNWVFYAAMNRDLRSIIKATTERRKRSTLSHQQSPPGNIRCSLRRQMVHSLRFFYSINSYRSNEDSVESVSTVHHPATVSTQDRHAVNEVHESPEKRVRAHTYAAPRTLPKDYTNPLPISAARYAAIKASKGSLASKGTKGSLASITASKTSLKSSKGSLLSIERIV